MRDVKCPYCGKDQDICHDDGYGYEEDVTHNQACHHCDKTFVYTTTIMFYYEAAKADCLNGADHKWEYTKTYPKEATRMVCYECQEEMRITEDERVKLMVAL